MRVILLSGIQGSNKSEYAKRYPSAIVCSADDDFTINGRHIFDQRGLAQAHANCLIKFTEVLRKQYEIDPIIIVDNANVTTMELAPYVALALAYGAHVELVTILCDIEIAAGRCIHNVPYAMIKRTLESLKSREIPRSWDIQNTTVCER